MNWYWFLSGIVCGVFGVLTVQELRALLRDVTATRRIRRQRKYFEQLNHQQRLANLGLQIIDEIQRRGREVSNRDDEAGQAQ